MRYADSFLPSFDSNFLIYLNCEPCAMCVFVFLQTEKLNYTNPWWPAHSPFKKDLDLVCVHMLKCSHSATFCSTLTCSGEALHTLFCVHSSCLLAGKVNFNSKPSARPALCGGNFISPSSDAANSKTKAEPERQTKQPWGEAWSYCRTSYILSPHLKLNEGIDLLNILPLQGEIVSVLRIIGESPSLSLC